MKRNMTGLVALAALAACASATPLPEHTLMLGEVVHLTPAEAAAGEVSPGRDFERFADALREACGVTAGNPGRPDLALVRFSYYWHNAGAPVRENGRWYPVQAGLAVVSGNLVEIELRAGKDGPDSRCPWVTRVLADDIKSDGCAYMRAEQGALRQAFDLLSPVGAAGAASLDCPGLADAGWEARPFGFYGAVAWVRTPEGTRE
jgi:hypothetical protein